MVHKMKGKKRIENYPVQLKQNKWHEWNGNVWEPPSAEKEQRNCTETKIIKWTLGEIKRKMIIKNYASQRSYHYWKSEKCKHRPLLPAHPHKSVMWARISAYGFLECGYSVRGEEELTFFWML